MFDPNGFAHLIVDDNNSTIFYNEGYGNLEIQAALDNASGGSGAQADVSGGSGASGGSGGSGASGGSGGSGASDYYATDESTLVFGSGIVFSDLSFALNDEGAVIVTVGTDHARITLDSASEVGTPSFVFADGTTLTSDQIIADAEANISGGTLVGGTGSDTLVPGGLFNTILGQGGADTILYDRDDGSLNIIEGSYPGTEQSILQFGSGISAADLTISADSENDILVTIGSTPDQITLTGMLDNPSSGVSEFVFSDGTTLSAAQITADAQMGSAQNTTLYADGGVNTLVPNGYANLVQDFNGGTDTVLYGTLGGNLTIDLQDYSGMPEASVLQFESGISASELSFTTDGSNNVIVTVGTTGNEIFLDGMYGNTAAGVSEFTFADGSTLTASQIDVLAQTASPENTSLWSDGENDTLIPDAYTTFIGNYSGGADTIDYGLGDGNLEIDEEIYGTAATPNALVFGTGISEGDITVSRDADDDIILTIASAGTTITLDGMAYEVISNPNWYQTYYGVNSVAFADGTTLSARQLVDMTNAGNPTNTTLVAGGVGSNTFDPNSYAHLIQGSGLADTILYNLGDGNLTIDEPANGLYNSVYPTTAESTLVLGAGITESEVFASEDNSGDILLQVGTSGGTITLTGELPNPEYSWAYRQDYGIGSIAFSDGTIWSSQQIMDAAATGSPYNTTLTANTGSTVDPNGYAHFVEGYGGSSVILYKQGYGDLTISDGTPGTLAQDVLSFGAGISENDVSVTKDGDNIYLHVSGPGNGTITLGGMDFNYHNIYPYAGYGIGDAGIGPITFADGTTWTQQQIFAESDIGSANNTSLTANPGNNVFDPNGFAHSVSDQNGGVDTILYNAGYGNLLVNEENPSGSEQTILQFGSSISEADISTSVDANGDVILTVTSTGAEITLEGMANSPDEGVGGVAFADGITWTAAQILSMEQTGTPGSGVLYGGYRQGTLNPAGFVHTIDGGIGDNTIQYNVGDGDLTINETASSNQQSVLQFGSGISATDIKAVGDAAGDIILTVASLGTQITLSGMLENSLAGVGSLAFADGSSLTAQQLVDMAETGSVANSTLYGNAYGVELEPNGPAHLIDVALQADTIDYEVGDGNLTIIGTYATGNGQVGDVLAFGSGISAADLAASTSNGNDLTLTIGTTGSRITLSNMLASGQVINASETLNYGVSEITFADGTTLSPEQVIALLDTGSHLNTTLSAGSGENTLDPAGYAHVIDGNGGADTILYNRGYGNLLINEQNASGSEQSVLALGASIAATDIAISGDPHGDILLTDTVTGAQITLANMLDSGANGVAYGVGSLVFDSSGTTLTAAQLVADAETGTPDNATLYAGGGDTTFQTNGYAQVINGNGGADTILYTPGEGNLQINECDPNGPEQSVLQFGSGISAADLSISTDGYGDVVVQVGTLGAEIGLTNMLSGTQYGVGSFVFADGTTLSAAQIEAGLGTISSAETTLYATLSNETLDTKGYADAIQGNGGADTIIYNPGYGNLKITEQSYPGPEQSVLQFGTGISESDVAVSQDQDGDIILGIGSPAAQITLVGMLQSDLNGVAAVEFADGTTWTASQIVAMTETGSPDHTTLVGGPGNNVFNPNGYAHVIDGDGGSDTILFNLGDGTVTVNEENQSGSEQSLLQFGTGIAASDISVSQDTYGDIVLTVGTAGDAVVLSNMINSGQNGISFGIGSATFVDGTTLSAQQITNLAETGSTANTVLRAGPDGDTIDPNGCAHLVLGGSGTNTILYNQGYGALTITEQASSGTEASILQFGNGISASDLSATTDAAGDIILTVGTQVDQITLTSMANGISFGVGEAVFADGTTLTAAQLDTLAASPTSLTSSFSGGALSIATTDEATVTPFAALAVTDANGGTPTETITVSLSNGANGTLYDPDARTDGAVDQDGILTITGSAADVSTVLEALVFVPAAHQVAPGDIVATTLTVTDVNSVGLESSTSVEVSTTAVNDTPVISGTAAAQIATDEKSLAPFANVVISDPDVGANDTVTLTVTGANGLPTDANGTLSGTGLTEISAGVYTLVAGAPPSLTAELDDLIFTPAEHLVAPGGTVTTGFMIAVAQNEAVTTDIATNVIATATNDPPVVAGTQAGQATSDEASVDPFSGVTVSDPDLGVTETATITLTGSGGVATDADGMLSGTGLTKTGAGSYVLAAATPAELTAELDSLSFSPKAHQVSPGQTVVTGFTLAVAQDGVTTTDTITNVIATAANDAPVISGAVAGQATTDEASLTPFSGVTVSDPDLGVTDSLLITLTGTSGVATDADGTLAGTGLTKVGAGLYSLAAASPASLSAELDGLTFTPSTHQVAPGSTVATGFDLSVIQNGLTTSNTETSVIVTAVNDAPVISGTQSGRLTTDEVSLDPFSSVTITDPDYGVTDSALITLTGASGVATDADGALSGVGLTKTGIGTYILAAASQASLTAELEALTFTPMAHQVAPGSTVTTGFDLSVTQNGLTATNTATSVIATAVNDAPVISGAKAGLTTTDTVSVKPFSSVTITDPDYGVTDSALITLTGTSGVATDADGALAGTGLTKVGAGLYSLAAASPASLSAELDGLTFTPTAHQVAAGSTVTTDFDLTVTQDGLATTNTVTSLIVTATGSTLVSNGTLYALQSGQTLNTGGTLHVVNGGSFANTILYNEGYGALTIEDANPAGLDQSILQLGSGISEGALKISSNSAGDIILKDGVAGDTIALTGMETSLDDGIGSVLFADGSSWTAAELVGLSALQNAATVAPDYSLTFGVGAKTISGAGVFVIGAGIAKSNVIFESNNSNGNLTIALLGANGLPTGDSLTINGYWWNNKGQATVLFPDGSTLSVGNQVLDTWIGTTTQTTLVGSDFSPNLFELGAGGDQVTLGATYDGGNGQNTLDFGYGDGAVTVTPNNASATIALGANILPSEVAFQSNNNNGNLTVELLNASGEPTGDSLTIDGYWWNNSGTNLAVFANGTTLTINHQLTDTWIGTTAQTTLVGSDFSPNLFDLGPGGDQVTLGATYDGGNGQNTLEFGYGDGAITVTPNQASATIAFGANILPSDVIFESNNDNGNLTIELLNASGQPTGDSMTINGYWWNSSGTNLAVFANGTTLALNHQLAETWIGSAAQTTLVGSDFTPNVFDLGPGGDHVTLGANYDGGNGQNIVNFGTGDGAVTITGNNGLASIDLAAGIGLTDVTLSTDSSGDIVMALADGTDKLVVSGGMYSSTFQQLDFANGTVMSHSQILYTAETGTTGNDTITVPSGPEMIDGRGGNDVINGGNGYDTYIYRQGYGNLTINNAAGGGTVANGELDFGPGITEQDFWFSRSGNNLDINVLGSKSQITVDNWFGSNAGAQLSEIKSYDGLEIDSGLNQLVAAMAVFETNNSAFNPETAMQIPNDTNLQAAIAAAWHTPA